MKSDVRHPEQLTLALLAGGELAWPEAMAARWHVCFCAQCKRHVADLRSARMELGVVSAADWQPSNDAPPAESEALWGRLEAEIRANIRLGLTAGSLASSPSIVERDAEDESSTAEDDVQAPLPLAPWRWAVVCAALVFVLTAGLWLRTPGSAPLPLASAPATENSTAEQASGQASGQGSAIQLLIPAANASRTETDFDGSTRSRVIDGETGQVTLQQVYVQ